MGIVGHGYVFEDNLGSTPTPDPPSGPPPPPPPPPPVTTTIIDDFERSAFHEWGTASSGFAWGGDTWTGDPDIYHTVSGGIGSFQVSNTSVYSNTQVLEIPHDISLIFEGEHEFSMRFRTSHIGGVAGAATHFQELVVENYGWTYFTRVHLWPSTVTSGVDRGHIRLNTASAPQVEVDKTSWLANTWYTLKWRSFITGTGTDALTVRAKLWYDSESEPDWMIETTGDYDVFPVDPGFTDGLEVHFAMTVTGTATAPIVRIWDVDDIKITPIVG